MIRDLRYTQWCEWGVESFEIRRCVTGWKENASRWTEMSWTTHPMTRLHHPKRLNRRFTVIILR